VLKLVRLGSVEGLNGNHSCSCVGFAVNSIATWDTILFYWIVATLSILAIMSLATGKCSIHFLMIITPMLHLFLCKKNNNTSLSYLT
jgi:hypothetical protein